MPDFCRGTFRAQMRQGLRRCILVQSFGSIILRPRIPEAIRIVATGKTVMLPHVATLMRATLAAGCFGVAQDRLGARKRLGVFKPRDGGLAGALPGRKFGLR